MNLTELTEDNLNKLNRTSIILGVPKIQGIGHVIINCNMGFIFYIEESFLNSMRNDLTTADIIEDILRTMNNYTYYYIKQ